MGILTSGRFWIGVAVGAVVVPVVLKKVAPGAAAKLPSWTEASRGGTGMPGRDIRPAVLILGATGVVLAYSGVRGKSVSKTVQALLAGQSPASAAQATPITMPTGDGTGGTVTPGGGVSLQSFYSDVLQGIGAPVSQGALNALAGISNTEGVNSYYNPLNIEWHPGDNPAWQGVGNFNDVGVQEYGSYNQGVQATVAFLKDNSGWSNVVAALRSGDQAMAEGALTSVYTWAQFKPAGGRAPQILQSPVGG